MNKIRNFREFKKSRSINYAIVDGYIDNELIESFCIDGIHTPCENKVYEEIFNITDFKIALEEDEEVLKGFINDTFITLCEYYNVAFDNAVIEIKEKKTNDKKCFVIITNHEDGFEYSIGVPNDEDDCQCNDCEDIGLIFDIYEYDEEDDYEE